MLDEITELLKKMIRNKCVNPPGNEMKNILTVKKFLDSYSIVSEIFESAPNRGNLLAEISGSSNQPSLMLGPSHVDVVPVENETKWTVPPFDGVVKDGCVWGRGSLDMLYIVACQTVVFAHLHKEGFKPKGDLKLLIVADEEAAGTQGAGWMVENHPDRVKVDYAITEQGGEPVAENRVAYWYGEKGLNWTRVRFRGRESHGSAPFGSENAAVKMAEGIVRIARHQPDRDMTIIKPLVEKLPMGGGTRRMVTSDKFISTVLGQLRTSNPGMAAYLHAVSQTTFSPNVCSSGTKINVVPGTAVLDIDIRTLPGHDEHYVRGEILKA
ncbi:MAG: M20/M25/M40 family metallo-hydrolase, partial [Candidatus Thorarchaeota archaeon]